MCRMGKAEASYQASIVLQQELYSYKKTGVLLAKMSEEVKAVMDHFEMGEGALNLKILQNVYMKNLRFISYDPETAIENLKKVLVLSNFLCGPTIQFKYS